MIDDASENVVLDETNENVTVKTRHFVNTDLLNLVPGLVK
jgi:hypothetical protein